MAVNRSRTTARLAVAGSLTALAAAAALSVSPPTVAQEKPREAAAQAPAVAAAAPEAARPPAPASAPATAAPLEGAGMRAFIDPATGKLRDPEPSDFPQTVAKKGAKTTLAGETVGPATADLDISVPGGGVARQLDDSTLVYTVATVGPDGSVRIEHTQGGEAAHAKVKAGGKNGRAAGGEVRHDR